MLVIERAENWNSLETNPICWCLLDMEWTERKTAIVLGAVVLLAAGIAVVVHQRSAKTVVNKPGLATHPHEEIVGVGIMIRFDAEKNAVLIAGIVPNSPAAEAGLSNGFVISKINGVSTEDKKIAECVNLLRGASGTKVTLELTKPDTNESKTVELTRKKIQLP